MPPSERQQTMMTPEHASSPKSLLKGELYQASSGKNWNVKINPPSPDGVSKESNGHSEVNERGAVVEDEISCSSTKSKESIDFLKDDKRDMTFSRRIALSLMNKKWYNPKAQDTVEEENDEVQLRRASSSSTKIDDFDNMMSNAHPNLEKSWAYFEHVALYRYLVPSDEKSGRKNIFARIWNVMRGKTKLERAEPGENDDPTRLYHPIMTPHSQLGYVNVTVSIL